MSPGTPSLLPSLSMARTLPLASSPNVSRHSQPTPLTIHDPHSSPCVLSQCLTTLPAYSPHYPWPALFPLRPLPMSPGTPSLLPSLSMTRTLPPSSPTPSLLPSLSMARTLPLVSSSNVSRHSQPTPLTIHDPHSSPCVLSQCLPALPAYSPHYP